MKLAGFDSGALEPGQNAKFTKILVNFSKTFGEKFREDHCDSTSDTMYLTSLAHGLKQLRSRFWIDSIF